MFIYFYLIFIQSFFFLFYIFIEHLNFMDKSSNYKSIYLSMFFLTTNQSSLWQLLNNSHHYRPFLIYINFIYTLTEYPHYYYIVGVYKFIFDLQRFSLLYLFPFFFWFIIVYLYLRFTNIYKINRIFFISQIFILYIIEFSISVLCLKKREGICQNKEEISQKKKLINL